MLYGWGSAADSHSQADRPLLSKYFQIIGALCQAAQQYISMRPLKTFDFKITTKMVMPRDQFNQEMIALIRKYLAVSLNSYGIMIRISLSLIHSLQLPSAFNKDWLLNYGNESDGNILRNMPFVYIRNGSCNCMISDACQEPLQIGTPGLELPGLVFGCSPFHGVRLSTLECFFSTACMMTIINHLNYNTSRENDTTIPTLLISPLQTSQLSRFAPTTTIGEIIDDVFIERWINVTSYEKYFLACAPSSCRYELTMRNTILYLITTLLGLYGGLTVGLKLVIWHIFQLYRALKIRMFRRRTAIEPFTTTIAS